jgi:hypothetical protein
MTESAMVRALLESPGVTEAVVLRTVLADREITVAVAQVSGYLSGPALRESLRQDLGDQHTPDAVLTVDQIPRLDGEVDQAALFASTDLAELVYTPPADPLEQQISQIWATGLGLPRVGVHDDFMDLGGESIAALRIMAETESTFGITLDAFELLDAGTVHNYARVVRERSAGR